MSDRQNELSVVLGEIEERANRQWHFAPAKVALEEAAQVLRDHGALVKALREAQMGFEVIRDMAQHAEPHSANYAKVKLADLAAILTQAKGELEEKQTLGERGAV